MTVTREYPGVFSNSHSSRKTCFWRIRKTEKEKEDFFLEKKNIFFKKKKRRKRSKIFGEGK